MSAPTTDTPKDNFHRRGIPVPNNHALMPISVPCATPQIMHILNAQSMIRPATSTVTSTTKTAMRTVTRTATRTETRTAMGTTTRTVTIPPKAEWCQRMVPDGGGADGGAVMSLLPCVFGYIRRYSLFECTPMVSLFECAWTV
ncbi:hypothetical protein BC938DRAFT_478762 [Jimgerdemannia flammicorona]|uniref:Uncharacterized protein n=1 Tax=Jimgerdemannia flammicorona TaxID=994334 RepID=A0A433QMD1_9FUNG|nr:hypothetical protein BC938DRAFT_478762 [Jimgerdemannia flammicorona]